MKLTTTAVLLTLTTALPAWAADVYRWPALPACRYQITSASA